MFDKALKRYTLFKGNQSSKPDNNLQVNGMSSIARFGFVGLSIQMIRDKLQCGTERKMNRQWRWREQNPAQTRTHGLDTKHTYHNSRVSDPYLEPI